MTALSDDQLRQVAAHIVLADARLSADDLSCISDQLDAALADLGITLDGKLEDVDDATLERIAEMIATATITVDWPDAKPLIPAAGIPADRAGFIAQLALTLAADGLVPEDQAPQVARVCAGLLRVAADAVAPELVRLRAERDEAVRVYTTMRDDRDRWQAAAQRERARIEAHVEPHRELVRARETAEAERDAMRPVVEAAVAWRNQPVDTWQPADEYERDIIAAVDAYAAGRDEVPPTPTTDAEIEALPRLDLAGFRPGHVDPAALAIQMTDDERAAILAGLDDDAGVDSGTSEPRTAGSGDAEPADGVVAAESDPLAEAIAAYFGGFVQEEGATYRHADFAEGLIESLTDAGWNLDAIGHPNTWALPAEPGPEVTAVRGSDGVRWVRAVRNAPGWRRDRGGSITVSWQTMLRDAAPLTDATGETP